MITLDYKLSLYGMTYGTPIYRETRSKVFANRKGGEEGGGEVERKVEYEKKRRKGRDEKEWYK